MNPPALFMGFHLHSAFALCRRRCYFPLPGSYRSGINIHVVLVAYDTERGTAPCQPKPSGNLAEPMSTAIGAVMSTRAPGTGQPGPGTDGQPAGGFVLRLLLGAQLRRFREAAGITPDRAGYEIRASRSKISRMENGNVGFKTRDVNDLLTLYGVTDEQDRSRILSITKQASQPDWWNRYSDVLPGWFENYLGLESVAATIRSFETQFV